MADEGDFSLQLLQDADGLPAQIRELSEDGAQAVAANIRQVRKRRSATFTRAFTHVRRAENAFTERHPDSVLHVTVALLPSPLVSGFQCTEFGA